jgi:hypothetical protein
MSESLSFSSPGGAALHRRAGTALILGGVAATSAAGLAFEIALTRVFAITQFYHFAFLSVSLALLGFGASGSALAAFPRLGRGGPGRWAWLAGGQSLTMIGAYALINALPFDSFAIAWDGRQVFYLVVYYLALAVPFFFGGLVVAALLTGGEVPDPIPSHRVYAASLAGSGVGAVIALGGLASAGGEPTIALSAAVAMGGATAFALAPAGGRRLRIGAATATIGLLLLTVAMPAPLDMRLSPYKDLSAALRFPGAQIAATRWDQGTRVDLILSDGIRSLPGLSLTYPGAPPHQDGVTFDGDDLSPVPRLSPTAAGFASHMLSSLAFRLRPGADALILAPRGGLDVVIALANGAASVLAVESHGTAVEVIRSSGASVYDDPRVTVTDADARTFVERTGDRFDVIDLALTSPYRPVTSGAYSLAENYHLTVEAFEQYFDRLAPEGILTAARWVQIPPSEEARLLAVAVQALRNRGRDASQAVIMLRNYSNAVLLVRPDGFTTTDVEQVEQFALAERFDIVAAPFLDSTNRFNVLPDEQYAQLATALLTAADLDAVYRLHEFDIAAPTDDQPFFGHFFKWSQASTVLDTLGRTWQPFGGAGYFVLIALLAISTIAALILIAAPPLIRRSKRRSAPASLRWWTLGYFGLLGVAFLFVEIPLIQQYILLLGHPTAAFAVVLFAILVGSGIGSAWSRRIPWRPAALVLTAAVLVYPFLVRWLTPLVLPVPSAVRIAAGVAMIFPVGFLMGIMFPWGLAHLERRAPHLVPWAWAINGTVSVISAAAAALLTLSYGFSFVVLAGAAAYGVAALLARPIPVPLIHRRE